MRAMPTLGPPQRRFPLGKLLAFLVLGATAGALYVHKTGGIERVRGLSLVPRWARQAPPPPRTEPAPPPRTEPAAPAPVLAPPDPLATSGLSRLRFAIEGPLERAVSDRVGAQLGPALTQVITRELVWWVPIPAGIARGDELDVLYAPRTGDEPVVHALRFHSARTHEQYRAYRFQADGDPFARFYAPDGNELELRLERSPVDTYDQITSRLRDGRRHQGVDFKTPVGTPVRSTFAGVVTRRNWNWRGNGNCLEVSSSSGPEKALFLHLDVLPEDVRVGTRIAAGQQIARSGNSGHSFAPHLHYQLMRGEDRVLDPFDVQATVRRALPAESMEKFREEVARLDALLDGSATSVASGN